MTKLYILQEIKRTTRANGGTPLRKIEFESETGIKRYDWYGVYWARWSDALREAGCLPQHVHAATRPQPSKPLVYDRSHTAPIVRLV
ncbi:MAG TPA: hypothetical protein VEI50_13085 [Nitrospiraceae bacterium]|nr:hypothetical protein [Nitrospiraceae bacterium]